MRLPKFVSFKFYRYCKENKIKLATNLDYVRFLKSYLPLRRIIISQGIEYVILSFTKYGLFVVEKNGLNFRETRSLSLSHTIILTNKYYEDPLEDNYDVFLYDNYSDLKYKRMLCNVNYMKWYLYIQLIALVLFSLTVVTILLSGISFLLLSLMTVALIPLFTDDSIIYCLGELT